MKKLKILQITIVALFIIFIFFFFRAVDYTKEYTVDEVKISESYDKENKSYYFTLEYQDVVLDYLYESSYKHNRTLIEKVDIIEDENNFCLIPSGSIIEWIPLCVEEGKNTYYKNVNENLLSQIPKEFLKEEKELDEEYEDITIYNRDYTYLLWNYDGFYFINEKDTKKIKLFDQERYNINLVGYTKDYLIIPDYEANYTFNKFYRISLSNGDVKTFDLDRDIYFDSYFPGFEKNKLYIIDNKEEIMYEWNAKNGDLEKIKAKMLNKGTWENVGIKTLINQNKKFTPKTNYEYTLEDGNLSLNYVDKDITTNIDEEVTSIVRIKDANIFYLKTDTLYVFNPLEGKKRLLNYFEWNFNYENMIYVN